MNNKSYLFPLFFLLPTALNAQTTSACDTILTTDGKTYIGHILQRQSHELQFSLCDDPLQQVYAVPTQRLAAIHRAGADPMHKKVAHKPKTSPSVLASADSNTVNRRPVHPSKTLRGWVSLETAQLTQKGICLTYEGVLTDGISYLVDAGHRWHRTQPKDLEVLKYEERITHQFLSAGDTYYWPKKPKDLGEFLPTRSAYIGGGLRFYFLDATKTNFFIQPSVAWFHHSGYKIEDHVTLDSSYTTSENYDSGWFYLGPSTTYNQFTLERRMTERASYNNFNASLTVGWRIAVAPRCVIDLGVCFGRSFKGVRNDIHYYGINDRYARFTMGVGWGIL